VRLLELWLRRHGDVREDALANYLRFDNSTALRFAPSQIESLDTDPPGQAGALAADPAALGAALQSAALRYIRLTPSFMGLLGASGALPAHYTERIAAHQSRARDGGPRALMDALSNRSLALFYQAWR
jgi:type VI secretion system protein ImpH